jgi:hypothetical protein
MANRTHYIAEIHIKQVEHKDAVPGKYTEPGTPAERNITTVANIILSDDYLDNLVIRSREHLFLLSGRPADATPDSA